MFKTSPPKHSLSWQALIDSAVDILAPYALLTAVIVQKGRFPLVAVLFFEN